MISCGICLSFWLISLSMRFSSYILCHFFKHFRGSVALVCIILMTNGAEHPFMCSLAIYISFCQIFFQIFCSFVIGLWFSCFWVVTILDGFWMPKKKKSTTREKTTFFLWHKWSYLQNRNRSQAKESRLVVASGGEGMEWDFRVGGSKLLHLE